MLFKYFKPNKRCALNSEKDLKSAASVKALISIVMIMIAGSFLHAQDCNLVPESEGEFDPASSTHCFDVESIQDNCTYVYININVHFFLDDDCQGELASAGELWPGYYGGYDLDLSEGRDAFLTADTWIDGVNDYLETVSANGMNQNHQWNQATHGATVTEAQCLPFRFLLKGVYIHCDSQTQQLTQIFPPYSENLSSEINVYVTDHQNSGSAYTTLGGRQIVTKTLGRSLLFHEVLHDFGIRHTTNDDCDDTWFANWSWDYNCDNNVDATGAHCWNASPTYNGTDACDANLYCETHPCCTFSNQNNNIMAGGQWSISPNNGALTPCQISEALNYINDFKCDFVADIGGAECPPVSAFIGTVPTASGEMDCPVCFELSTSYNETIYDINIFDSTGDALISTGHIYGEATSFCLTPEIDKFGNPFWSDGFVGGQTYTFELEVANDCGDEDSHSLDFVLPTASGCAVYHTEEQFDVIDLFADNLNNKINIEYLTSGEGTLQIYGAHIASGESYGMIYEETLPEDDSELLQLDMSNWTDGINGVILLFNDEIYVHNIIKV